MDSGLLINDFVFLFQLNNLFKVIRYFNCNAELFKKKNCNAVRLRSMVAQNVIYVANNSS